MLIEFEYKGESIEPPTNPISYMIFMTVALIAAAFYAICEGFQGKPGLPIEPEKGQFFPYEEEALLNAYPEEFIDF